MILSEHPRIELLNMDCMSYMAECRDKQFSLAIVDPPYGIGFDKENLSMSSALRVDGTKRKMKSWSNPKPKGYTIKEWDKDRPDKGYFQELKRISINQIIWGGNYFTDYLEPHGGWIVWDKGVPDGMSLSQAELAYNTFLNSIRIIKILWAGYKKVDNEDRFHPTQKPVKLYEWLLTNYAKPGDTILDTHGGSFSSAIAAYRLGFDFTGIELDADYFNAAVKRFKEQTAQLDAFRQPKPATVTQLTLNPYGDKLCPNCNRHHSEAGSFCCTACEFGI